jgi:hypothetical protein
MWDQSTSCFLQTNKSRPRMIRKPVISLTDDDAVIANLNRIQQQMAVLCARGPAMQGRNAFSLVYIGLGGGGVWRSKAIIILQLRYNDILYTVIT